MANIAANKGAAIEDHGLIRAEVPCRLEDVAFMTPWLDQLLFDWQGYIILLLRKRRGDIKDGIEICTYAVSLSNRAYVTLYIKLTKTEEIGSRRINNMNMKYRDMIVDNVRAAGADMRKIKVLGVMMILNEPARTSMERVFKAVGKNILSRGAVEITQTGNPKEYLECLTNNPFARGQRRMLDARAADTGNAFIDRFILISEGYDGPPGQTETPYGEPQMHMITTLGRHESRM